VRLVAIALAGAGAALLAALPSTEYLGTVAGAVVAGCFAGAGIGYPIYRRKRTDADIAAYRALEEARKGTTLQALADAHEEIRRIQDLMAERDRLAAEKARQADAIVRAKDDLIETQQRELAALRTEAERMRTITLDFAKDVLHQHGWIREEGEDESAVPAGPDRGG